MVRPLRQVSGSFCVRHTSTRLERMGARQGSSSCSSSSVSQEWTGSLSQRGIAVLHMVDEEAWLLVAGCDCFLCTLK